MEPILGMRFETPHQLKMALANYGVAHGYQLCYMKNDWRASIVYCVKILMKEEVRRTCKKPIKKVVKKPVKKIPDSQSGRVLGALISDQYFKEIIEDSFIPLRKMRDDIRQKFMIDMSVGQCKRAKQLALFDYEGGLIEHYAKLYQYKQAILDSNPGFTCTLDVVESDRTIGALRFLHLLHDDLCLNDGTGITIISDSHKSSEHRKMYKNIYANFKEKDQWVERSVSETILWLSHALLTNLIQRDPNSNVKGLSLRWTGVAAFENGISESFNRAILGPRMKPIITMLEEIREWVVYPSRFQELEVRKCDQSYGVSLQHKVSVRSGIGDGQERSVASVEERGGGIAVEVVNGVVVRACGKWLKWVVEGLEESREMSRGVISNSSSEWYLNCLTEEYQLELDEQAF
ncbi:hypothetical protein Tco_1385319 [Tanacetum coccineum]